MITHKFLLLVILLSLGSTQLSLSHGRVWTLESLKQYTDLKESALAEKVDLQFRLNQIAIDKSEVKLITRMDGMNEFREQLRDQASTF